MAEASSVQSNSDLLKQMEAEGVKEMYAVEPLKDCPHLCELGEVPEEGLDVNAPCEDCQNVGENWVCLVCYKVYCSRYVKEHMVQHGKDADHPLVLSYTDLSAWCYKCDNYIDNEKLTPPKSSAHKSKFGTELE